MPPAARVTDQTTHPGFVAGPGTPTPFPMGSLTVLIGGRPALRMGDVSACGATIISGAPTVLVNG
jgi:uncharacterized Zn-binding protein involved in type VI secretion